MEALSQDVLQEGLKIQQALLPEAVCRSSPSEGYMKDLVHGNGESIMPDGMFFHTPLLYWNCSLSAVENDHRILKTVNENLFQQSAAGITLRWGSVFAGKQFSHQKLIAADALVISMFYDLNSTAGELWDQRAVKIAKEAQIHKRFNVYPSNGKEDYNLLYEVRYEKRNEAPSAAQTRWQNSIPC